MNIRHALIHLMVILGWVYIVSGLIFFAWGGGTGHWWSLSALIAGSSALTIHIIEIPFLWKKGLEKGRGPWGIIWRTLIFGVIWLVFPIKDSP